MLFAPSSIADRSRRPTSPRLREENENRQKQQQQAVTAATTRRNPRPDSAAPRIQTQTMRPGSARPPSARRPVSARRASRPASAASAGAPKLRESRQPNVPPPQHKPEWKQVYRPATAQSGGHRAADHCSVKAYRPATAAPLARPESAGRHPRSARPATARVDCGQRPSGSDDGRGTPAMTGALQREIVALLRVMELERSRSLALRPTPGSAPDVTSLACYSKVFERLIDRCVALRPLLSKIKEGYDNAAYGHINALQTGAAKLIRAQTGVDRITKMAAAKEAADVRAAESQLKQALAHAKAAEACAATEQHEAIDAEARAEKEEQEAIDAEARAEKELWEAHDAGARADKEHREANEAWLALKTEEEGVLRVEAEVLTLEKKLAEGDNVQDQLDSRRADLVREKKEADAAKEKADQEYNEAVDAKVTAVKEKAEAREARAAAATEKAEAGEARATALKEKAEALEATSRAVAARAEIQRRQAVLRQEKEQAEEAATTAERFSLNALELLATSDNPSDGRYAPELHGLERELKLATQRRDFAQEKADKRMAKLAAGKQELATALHSVENVKATVDALRRSNNRSTLALQALGAARQGNDQDKNTGYWKKREIEDTKRAIIEERGLMGREAVKRNKAEANLRRETKQLHKLHQDTVDYMDEMQKWGRDEVELKRRTRETEDSFGDYRRSVGPGTPRPAWDEIRSFLNEADNNESKLHLDLGSTSSTLALEMGSHVKDLKQQLNDTIGAIADAAKIKDKQQEDEAALKLTIEAEVAAVAEAYTTKKYFVMDGTGPHVPVYMRGTGKVRDLLMPKAEAEEIIKNVWDTKIRSDSRKGAKKKGLPEFFAGWVKTAFGVRALEKTYNLVDALKRFEYDADCALFFLVLKGELSEQVYIEEGRMIDGFMHVLVEEARSQSNAGDLKKTLRRSEFLALLEGHFGHKKTPDEMQGLQRALVYDQPTPHIKYTELLEENERADQGQFAEELRDQFLVSVQQSYIAVEQSVREATLRRAQENGKLVLMEGAPRILCHRVINEQTSCMKQCDTLMKESLLLECFMVEYKQDDMVIVEGDSGAKMYIVIQGSCWSEKNGHEKLVEYKPGGLFGELSALADSLGKPGDDMPLRQATVTAHKDGTLLLVLDRADLLNKKEEALAAGETHTADACDCGLAAISKVLLIEQEVARVTLDNYSRAERTAEAKRAAKAASDEVEAPKMDRGLWVSVASCWQGCMDYLGEADPSFDYEKLDREKKEQEEHGDAEVAGLTSSTRALLVQEVEGLENGAKTGSHSSRLGKKKHAGAFDDGPVPAVKRARPLMLAGLGEDAGIPGWEAEGGGRKGGAGGLTSTRRIWLPEFVSRMRSVSIPLPRPEWLVEQAALQGAEVVGPGGREISMMEKDAVETIWKELDKAGDGCLPSSKLMTVVEQVYGYELTQKEQHALLLATRYGGDVVDNTETSVTESEFLHAMATVVELRSCAKYFGWRRVFKKLQPPSTQSSGERPRGMAATLVAIKPEAALYEMGLLRHDITATVLARRLDDQLVQQVKQKQLRKNPKDGLEVSRFAARKKGDVDWEMFVRVLQSKGELSEGEAVEMMQCMWRSHVARRHVREMREMAEEQLKLTIEKSGKKKGKGKGKSKPGGKTPKGGRTPKG